MTLRQFIHDQEENSAKLLEHDDYENDLDKYRVVNRDWDYFIKEFNGISCNNLCMSNRPLSRADRLFRNSEASAIFCRWCNK